MRWLYVIAWMSVIYFFSDQPHSARVTQDYFGDLNVAARKAGHILEYTILCGLILFALKRGRESLSVKQVISAAFISLIYAATDEYHQSFVAGRSAAATDVLIDSIGIIIASAAVLTNRGTTCKH